MSKKSDFMARLDRNMDPNRAAELSGISSRKVKWKYLKEWKLRPPPQLKPEESSEMRTQFEQEFHVLPAELKAFWAELCQKEALVLNGNWQEDFDNGRHLEEMLLEWQLFYSQPKSVRAAFLCRPVIEGEDRYAPGSFARFMRRAA